MACHRLDHTVVSPQLAPDIEELDLKLPRLTSFIKKLEPWPTRTEAFSTEEIREDQGVL
jgi:hypothetical protein